MDCLEELRTTLNEYKAVGSDEQNHGYFVLVEEKMKIKQKIYGLEEQRKKADAYLKDVIDDYINDYESKLMDIENLLESIGMNKKEVMTDG